MIILIYSASTWRKNIEWNISVDLSTNPNNIIMTDDLGSKSISGFTQSGSILNFKCIPRSSKFTVKLNTESKTLTFGEDEDSESNLTKGAIKAYSSGSYIFLPVCDVEKLDLNVYNSIGTSINIQNLNQTPFWTVSKNALYSNVIEGITIPTIRLDLNFTNTRYLASSETNTWELLNSIPFRVIIENVSNPFSDWRSLLAMNSIFYGKQFYADFN